MWSCFWGQLYTFDAICYGMVKNASGKRFTWREIVESNGECVKTFCDDTEAMQDYAPQLYSIHDATGKMIYAGKSFRTAGRLCDHIGIGEYNSQYKTSDAAKVQEWIRGQQPQSLDYMVCVWNLPQLLEDYLIRTYRPTFNKKGNEKYYLKYNPVGGKVIKKGNN